MVTDLVAQGQLSVHRSSNLISDEPKGPEDSPLYVIELFPIRAKLKTQKLAAVLDHVAHSPHRKGPIVVGSGEEFLHSLSSNSQ